MSHKAIALIVLAASLVASTAAFADTTEDDVTWVNQCIADNKKEGATEDVVRKYCVCMNNAMSEQGDEVRFRMGEVSSRRDEGLRQGSRLEVAAN